MRDGPDSKDPARNEDTTATRAALAWLLGLARFPAVARPYLASSFFDPPLPLSGLLGFVAAVILIALLLWGGAGYGTPWPYLALTAGAVEVAGYAVVRRRRTREPEHIDALILVLILAVVGQGIAWGMTVVDLLGTVSAALDAILLLLVAALAGSVCAAFGGVTLVVSVFVVPAMGLTAFALLRQGDPLGVAAAGLVVLYGGFLLVLSRQTRHFMLGLFGRQYASEERIETLTRGRDRLRAVLGAAPIPIVVTSVQDGRVLFLNQFARELFQFEGRIDTLPLASAFYPTPQDRKTFLNAVLAEEVVRNRELRMRRANGETFWALTSSSLMEYEGEEALVSSFSDITPAKMRETELEHLAATDALTGISNRRSFLDALERERERSLRYGHTFALLMIDLDHFKAINDTYGHSAGDLVLRELVDVLTANLRANDLLGRIGGEEFAALLPETTLDDAATLAERLRAAVNAAPIAVESTPLGLTVSIGVVVRGGDDDVAALLRRADMALYEAKRLGRNQVVSEAALASATR
ncbi:sensor domain-containing diguanylate cyclase [Ectothiorhodospiraceae bacterium WFHF3C12]|nr:sensor domain-containing diguanylate cyclase [Ectothiorhodospiraceae bacterium WFHF3C12]